MTTDPENLRSPDRTILLGELRIEIYEEEQLVETVWPDDLRLSARPTLDADSIQRARDLGYGRPEPGRLAERFCEAIGAKGRDYWWVRETVEQIVCEANTPSDEEAVWRMTKDHDLCHHLIARAEGKPWSEHLRLVAEGKGGGEDGHREECLVFAFQRLAAQGLPMS